MIDWGKYWITNAYLIRKILAINEIGWEGFYSQNTGEVFEYPVSGDWNDWVFEIKSPTLLQITGSLHKFWNGGTNESDFPRYALYKSIVELCAFLKLSPYNLTVHNVEFGANIKPSINASEIMGEIICYKNKVPEKIIDKIDGYYFRYRADEYYFKVYDKGLQANKVWKHANSNIFRVELKAMNSGYLQFANIVTMADLLISDNLVSLGERLEKTFKGLVFDDNTIDPLKLKKSDRKIYEKLRNPREWKIKKETKESTLRKQKSRFREIVTANGLSKYSETLSLMICDKWEELLKTTPEQDKEINEYLEKSRLELCRFSDFR